MFNKLFRGRGSPSHKGASLSPAGRCLAPVGEPGPSTQLSSVSLDSYGHAAALRSTSLRVLAVGPQRHLVAERILNTRLAVGESGRCSPGLSSHLPPRFGEEAETGRVRVNTYSLRVQLSRAVGLALPHRSTLPPQVSVISAPRRGGASVWSPAPLYPSPQKPRPLMTAPAHCACACHTPTPTPTPPHTHARGLREGVAAKKRVLRATPSVSRATPASLSNRARPRWVPPEPPALPWRPRVLASFYSWSTGRWRAPR